MSSPRLRAPLVNILNPARVGITIGYEDPDVWRNICSDVRGWDPWSDDFTELALLGAFRSGQRTRTRHVGKEQFSYFVFAGQLFANLLRTGSDY